MCTQSLPQGGRVYDSAIGTTCHWCRQVRLAALEPAGPSGPGLAAVARISLSDLTPPRDRPQKTVELKVACTAALCSVGRLPVLFCGGCLANRHGEDLTAAMASGAWVCPRCRGGCGAGCCDAATQRMGCCNCGPCRKKVELSPTGQIAGVVYHAGYSNAHDYLCGSAAGLDQKAMDARRVAKGWGAWVLDPSKLPVAPASPVAGGQGAAARGSDESEEEEELPPGFASSAGRRAGTPVPRLVAPPPAGASRLSQVFQAAKAAPPAAVGDKRKADGETGAAGRAKRAAGRAN